MADKDSLPEEASPFTLEDHPPSVEDDSSQDQEPDDDIQDPQEDPNPNLTWEETIASSSPPRNLQQHDYQPDTVEGLESSMGGLYLSNNPRPATNTATLIDRPWWRKGYVLSMAKDRWGSRSMQAKIVEGKPEVVEMILSEVKSHVHDLLTHPFGTHLVQKIFQETTSVSDEQKDSIVFLIISNEPKLRDVCMDNNGTRAIQQMVDSIKERPRTISAVVDALKPITAELMKDGKGSWVILHCIELLGNPEYKKVFLDEMARNCVHIARDKFGCAFIQKCLRHAEGEATTQLVGEIIINAVVLSEDPYGNYVVQFIIMSELPSKNGEIIEQLRGKFAGLSMNKHASNVVEGLLKFSKPNDAAVIVREIMESNDFMNVLQHPFGNFVAQKALECTKGPLHGELSNIILSYSGNLRSHPFGKRVLEFVLKGRKCNSEENVVSLE